MDALTSPLLVYSLAFVERFFDAALGWAVGEAATLLQAHKHDQAAQAAFIAACREAQQELRRRLGPDTSLADEFFEPDFLLGQAAQELWKFWTLDQDPDPARLAKADNPAFAEHRSTIQSAASIFLAILEQKLKGAAEFKEHMTHRLTRKTSEDVRALRKRPKQYDSLVTAIKNHAELKSPLVFDHTVVTSLHLLFSICDAEAPFLGRREVTQFVDLAALTAYLRDQTKCASHIDPSGKCTTNNYEAIFECANRLADQARDPTVSPIHLLQSISALRPRSITAYWHRTARDWLDFDRVLSCQAISKRAFLDTPS